MNCPRCHSSNVEYDKAMSRSAAKHVWQCRSCAKWFVMQNAPIEEPQLVAAPGPVTSAERPKETPASIKQGRDRTPKPKAPKLEKVVTQAGEVAAVQPKTPVRYQIMYLVCPACARAPRMELFLDYWRCPECGYAIEDGLIEVPAKAVANDR